MNSMFTRFTEKVRFSQLKEGDLFTFRKDGQIGGHSDDELLRYNNVIDNGLYKVHCNALCYGGAWFKINNTRAWVWRIPD